MQRVIVVDDVEENITLLSFELEDDNFVVIPALSGQECLDIISNDRQPDIILLDINMPGLSGIETLKRLKENEVTHDIPVIMVSADDTQESIVEAIDLGAHDFVTKPIQYEVLAARMRSALRLSQALRALEKVNEELNTLATTDSLTSTYNRRHFFTLVDREIAKKQRHDRNISVMMVDIDHFKKINDTYGHAAGDYAIKKLVGIMRGVCRSYDIIGRLGGEEFAVCFPYADLAGANAIGERIRKTCRVNPVRFQGHVIEMTVSIGVTELSDDEDFNSALQRADALLYESKESGRDQVISRSKY